MSVDAEKINLILNGAEQRLQIVLAKEKVPILSQEWLVPGRAMQFLAPALDQALTLLSLTPKDLSGVACVRGPGSFTGLRIVLATALGFAKASDLPLAGLDYPPLLAQGPIPLLHGTLAVLTHSRTRQVYAQTFSAPGCEPLSEPESLMLEQIPALLQDKPRPWSVLGSGLRRNRNFFEDHLEEAVFLDPIWDNPRPESLAHAAARARFHKEPIALNYLRTSDAEENLDRIARSRGLTPEDAARRLAAATSNTHT